MNKRNLFWALAVIAGFLLVNWVMSGNSAHSQQETPGAISTSYDQIHDELQSNPQSVKKVTFTKDAANGQVTSVSVELTNGTTQTAEVPGDAGASNLLTLASADKNVQIEAVTQKQPAASSGDATGAFLLMLLIQFGPVILLVGVMIWIMRKQMNPRGQMGKFSQSGAQKITPVETTKTFADVAGCENAKLELAEIVEFLKNPSQLRNLGGKRTKGVLLVGDPGNGKTLLAKAVAGEAKVPFFQMAASQFVEMFVGVGASRVRDLFNSARQNQPCIIFIDEIDAVGRQRGTGLGGGNDEREQTLNQLLVEMDGFLENDAIVIMAATNRPDILDPALVRPGRFDMQVLVDYPDIEGRIAILKVHTRKMRLAADVDLRHVAVNCPGFSGAQLEGAANQAALVANRRINKARNELKAQGKSASEIEKLVPLEITLNDFDEGVTRVQMGPASDKAMSKEDLINTAYHELGHAYVSQVMYNEGKGGDPVTKITIVARARALGYTQALPKGDRYNYTDHELIARIMMAMGGRVAQEIFLNTVDTGASNDFEQGTRIARSMVTKYGMSKLGTISVGDAGPNPFLGRSMAESVSISPELQNEIDREWRRIVNECYAATRELIERDRACFKKIADVLLAQETILGPQWEELFNGLTCQAKKIVHNDLPPVRPEPCDACEHESADGSTEQPKGVVAGLIGKVVPQKFLGGWGKPKPHDDNDSDGQNGSN